MTHTSTEHPEALRLADALRDGQYSLYQERAATEAELRRLHARVQEQDEQLAHMADLVEMADYATKKLEAAQAGRVVLIARNLAEWHEDDGPVAWWAWCGSAWAGEPCWIGTPNSEDWPGYHTHWTIHPEIPAAHGITQEKQG